MSSMNGFIFQPDLFRATVLPWKLLNPENHEFSPRLLIYSKKQ